MLWRKAPVDDRPSAQHHLTCAGLAIPHHEHISSRSPPYGSRHCATVVSSAVIAFGEHPPGPARPGCYLPPPLPSRRLLD